MLEVENNFADVDAAIYRRNSQIVALNIHFSCQSMVCALKGALKHQAMFLSPQLNKNENFVHYLAFLNSSWIVIKKQKKSTQKLLLEITR